MLNSLTLDLPYSLMEDIKEDKSCAIKLLQVYSNKHGELNAILQYIYQFFIFNNLGKNQSANTIMQIALAEIQHFHFIRRLLISLGVEPKNLQNYTIFPDFCKAKHINGKKDVTKLILDDISLEMVSINTYQQIIDSICNQKVKEIIERIKADEQLHIKILMQLFEEEKKK